MLNKTPSLTLANLAFYDTPDDIEGSPYWVDLWAHVNGYRIGLQVKPKTYNASSISIYTGKARTSQSKGFELFKRKFGGKVFMVMPIKGEVDSNTLDLIEQEASRLNRLQPGPYPILPDNNS